MGNTFFVKEAVFRGHAVEDTVCSWGAVELGQGSAPERKVVDSGMPSFWDQSQDGLQMEEAIYSRWTCCIAGPIQTATANARTTGRPMDRAYREDAQKESGLGSQEDPCAVSAAKIAAAQRTNDWPMVEAIGFYAYAAQTTSQSLCARASSPDGGAAFQSRLDSRLQGLVSKRQWRALRTFDRTRFVQSLRFVGSSTGQSARAACPGRFYCTFSATRIARGDSDRQRKPVCFHRPSGPFASECLVGSVGDRSGIYSTWLSARQWGTRAISSRHEKRNDPPTGMMLDRKDT